MSEKITSENHSKQHKRLLIILFSCIVIFSLLYQIRPFVDSLQFSLITIPAFSILPGILVGYAAITTIKLFKQKHMQAKSFFFYTIGLASWFIAEQIWLAYDYFWEGDPFPSEADIFYIIAYPFMAAFLFYSLKPILKSVSRNVWLFAIGLSFSFLIATVPAAFNDMLGEPVYATLIALAYPILSSFQLVPAIIGVMFLTKNRANLSWMLILFGFIVYSIADSFFLLAELDGSYYDGHPTDLMYIASFLFLLFAVHLRYSVTKLSISENQTVFFSKNIKFETISRFGITLTVSIVCITILISLFNTVIIQPGEQLSTQNIMLGVVAMLAVFGVIVITINKNLSRMVKMRTTELTEQRDNLEDLVAEKTQEVLKSERLSAIGELSGRLAHDLRNPLSVMKMSVDLIKQSSPDAKVSDETVSKRINLIEKSIDRISHQVDDVLGYVRHSPLKLSEFLVNEIIKNSIDKINVPDDVEIIVSKNKIKMNCDVEKIDAVFINILVNSIQAMHKGGKIEILIKEKDNLVVLEFIDNGVGISDADLDKVFEPLFTTKQKGTGLGLASCKNIVEQHQGEIFVKNNP
ncbi:MAG: ATP-binding protein, partial [Nitrosopumilus sp.]